MKIKKYPHHFNKKHYLFNSLKLLGIIGVFAIGLFSYPLLFKNKQEPYINVEVLNTPTIEACFTPNQACLPKVINYIDKAQNSIAILGYSFTSKPITNALIRAKKRGVDIKIILDHSQRFQKSSKLVIAQLLNADIDIKFDHSVKIAHNKVMIIDGNQTLTGSYNWTHSAEFKNAENLIFIKSQEICAKYKKYFDQRWNVAR